MDGDLTFGVAIKSTGDGSVVADAKSATSELENMKKATDELAASQVKMASQSRASEDDIMRYYTGLSVAEDNAKAKAWALANGYQEAGGQMVKATEAAADGMGKLSIGTHRAYQEMVVLAREAARGNFSRMASSGSILLSQLTPLGLGIAGVTALVAAGAYAYEKMTNAVDAETAAAQENDKQFQALSASLRDQNVLLERRIQLAAGGQVASVTGLSDEEVNKMFELEQTITRIKGDMADGVKIGHDGFYLSEELAQNQKKLNELLDEANGKQEKNNQLKAQSQGKNLGADAEKELGKTYADAQRLDAQMVGSHQSAFDKTIAAWISMQQKMEAAGIYYGRVRQDHEAAYTTFVNAENLKRNAAAEAAKAKRLASDNLYFAQMANAAAKADHSAEARLAMRYKNEMADWNKRHTLAKINQDYSVAEEEKFQQAKLDIQQSYENEKIQLAIQSAQQIQSIEQSKNAVLFQLASSLIPMATGNAKARAVIQASLSGAEVVMNYEVAAARAFAELGPIAGAPVAAAMESKMFASLALVAAQAALGFGNSGASAGSSGGGGGATITTHSTITPASPKTTAPATPIASGQALQQLNITVIGAKDNPNKAVLSFNALVDIVNGINQVGQRGHRIKASVIAS